MRNSSSGFLKDTPKVFSGCWLLFALSRTDLVIWRLGRFYSIEASRKSEEVPKDYSQIIQETLTLPKRKKRERNWVGISRLLDISVVSFSIRKNWHELNITNMEKVASQPVKSSAQRSCSFLTEPCRNMSHVFEVHLQLLFYEITQTCFSVFLSVTNQFREKQNKNIGITNTLPWKLVHSVFN